MFRDARDPATEHILRPGATGYGEAVAKWREGFRWLDEQSGTFLRRQAAPGTRRAAPRDYLSIDYLSIDYL